MMIIRKKSAKFPFIFVCSVSLKKLKHLLFNVLPMSSYKAAVGVIFMFANIPLYLAFSSLGCKFILH